MYSSPIDWKWYDQMVADDEKRKQLKASLLIDFDDVGAPSAPRRPYPPSKWDKDLMFLFGVGHQIDRKSTTDHQARHTDRHVRQTDSHAR